MTFQSRIAEITKTRPGVPVRVEHGYVCSKARIEHHYSEGYGKGVREHPGVDAWVGWSPFGDCIVVKFPAPKEVNPLHSRQVLPDEVDQDPHEPGPVFAYLNLSDCEVPVGTYLYCRFDRCRFKSGTRIEYCTFRGCDPFTEGTYAFDSLTREPWVQAPDLVWIASYRRRPKAVSSVIDGCYRISAPTIEVARLKARDLCRNTGDILVAVTRET